MTRHAPPIIATWVLSCFVGENEALIGDLIEEYRNGCSRLWYWKEVLIAVFRATGTELRAHWVLSLRLIFLLGAIQWCFGHWFVPLLWYLFGVLLRTPYWLPVACGFSALLGWIVARIHRPHQAAVALLNSAMVFLAAAPRFCRLAEDSFGNDRFRTYLYLDVAFTVLLCFSALLGGLWSSPNGIERQPKTPPTHAPLTPV
jgi:hypothetical protein